MISISTAKSELLRNILLRFLPEKNSPEFEITTIPNTQQYDRIPLNKSIYIIKRTKKTNKVQILRISNHRPNVRNFIDKNKDLKLSKNSTNDILSVEFVDTFRDDHDIKMYPNMEYKINAFSYAYNVDFLESDDLYKLSSNIKTWFNNKGNKPFEDPFKGVKNKAAHIKIGEIRKSRQPDFGNQTQVVSDDPNNKHNVIFNDQSIKLFVESSSVSRIFYYINFSDKLINECILNYQTKLLAEKVINKLSKHLKEDVRNILNH